MNGLAVAIIQARMSSERLPGKVLRPLGRAPVLAWTVSRVASARRVDRVVVATSDHASDDPIVEWAGQTGTTVVRGSLDDVLDRYRLAAEATDATTIIRITADCPFVDATVIDAALETFASERSDYCSTKLDGRYPIGLDVEVVRRDVLMTAAAEFSDPDEREHVTLGIYRRPERFSCVPVPAPEWAQAPEVRITLDEASDYDLLTRVVAELGMEEPGTFDCRDAIKLLSTRPDLKGINADVVQRRF